MRPTVKVRDSVGSIRIHEHPCRFKYGDECRAHAPVALPVYGGEWRSEQSSTHYPKAKCPCGEYEQVLEMELS